MTKWLFDHDAAPELTLSVLVLVLTGQLCLAELIHHGAKEPIGDREIEDHIALCAVRFFGLVQGAAKLLVHLGLGQVAMDVGHLPGEAFPHILVDMVDVELGCGVADKAFKHVV